MILLQEDRFYKMTSMSVTQKLKTWLQVIKLHHATALSMIGMGILYPTYSISLPGMLQDGLSFGFWIWSALMIFCGLGLMWKPEHVVIWLVPYIIFLIPAALLAIRGDSYTALLYYSQLYIFTLYFSEYRTKRLPLNGLQIAGIFQFIFGIVLIVNPYGSGLTFLYDSLSWVRQFGINPVLFYQLLYLIFGLLLIPPGSINKRIAQILTAPFMIHGLMFITVSISFGAWAFAPLFIGITIMWVHVGGADYA